MKIVKKGYVYDAVHFTLIKEIERVLWDCDKNGIFISKKIAGAIVSEKSKRGKMSKEEIIDYVRKIRGLIDDNKK